MADTRAELGKALCGHRKAAEIGQQTLAERMGWSQAGVSRVENGAKRIEPGDVRRWLDHVHAPENAYGPLLELAERADTEVTAWREMHAAGWDKHQKKYDQLERDADVIRAYHFDVIPGLMQTASYTTTILRDVVGVPDDQLGIGVTARQARQAVLYQPGTNLQIVVSEALLRHRLGGPAVIVEQLHRIATLARLSTVTFQVIPTDTDMLTWYGTSFDLYELADDESVVLVELDTGEVRETNPQKVAHYRTRHQLLQGVALEPAESIGLVERIAAEATSALFPA